MLVALITDLGVCGVWLLQVKTLFDVRMTDVDAPSYVHHSVADVLTPAINEKMSIYRAAAAKENHASFHLLLSLWGHEADLLELFHRSHQLVGGRPILRYWGMTVFYCHPSYAPV